MQLVFPTSGRAEILGRPLGDLDGEAPHRLPPRESVLLRLPDRRGAADVFRARSSATAAPKRAARVARLLDEVGIGAERRLQLRKFSKGMLQRVGIAQALINDPELVILDEPMSGLDPLGRRDVRSLILRLRDRGMHGLLQLARPERRRSAVQPCGDSRARPAGRDRTAGRNARVPGARLGARRRRRSPPRPCRARRSRGASCPAHRRRRGTARAAARTAAGAAAGRADRGRRATWCR